MKEEPKEIEVTISTGTVIRVILTGVAAFLVYFLRDIVLIVLTAIVIASAIEPATAWFTKRRMPRLPSVIFVYLCIILVLAVVFYFLLPTLLNETSGFLEKIDSIDITGALQSHGWLSSTGALQGLSQHINITDITASIRNTIAGFSNGFFDTVSKVFGGALSFIIIFVLSFYFSVQEDGVQDFLQVIAPIRHKEYVTHLWKRSQTKIGLWLQGQLLLGLLVGVLVYLGLTILGVNHGLLLAVLAAIFEIIPLFGPILSAVPGIAIAVTSGGLTLGLVVMCLYIIIQQFENHLIYPLVVNKVVGVSPILVIISLLIGWEVAGFLGVILAVPVAAIFMEYYSDVRKNKFSGRNV